MSRKGLHNHYPVHTYGRLTPKHDKAVTEYYIPYLEMELKKAVESGQSTVIQTYIMALGNIGHPKILPVLEPYLEGKVQVTVFQRTLMVSALAKLAENFPKLARSILYKIYLNTMEEHQSALHRCLHSDADRSSFNHVTTNGRIYQDRQEQTRELGREVDFGEPGEPEGRWISNAGEESSRCKESTESKRLQLPLLSRIHYESNMDEGNIISHMMLKYIGSDDSLIPTLYTTPCSLLTETSSFLRSKW